MKIALNVKTAYSFLQSNIDINRYLDYAVHNNLAYLAICDDNLHASIDFYLKCIKNKIKPIIGLRVTIDGNEYLLYAKNYVGLQDLFVIATSLSERVLVLDDINQIFENVILLTKADNLPLLTKPAFKYELLENKKVAYLTSKEQEYVKYLMQIGELEDIHITSLEESINKEYQYEFINDIELTLPEFKVDIPAINDENNNYNIEYLKSLSTRGLSKRLGSVNNTYRDRLHLELSTIIEMGFVNYFLIVYDYVLYAKKHQILVGPGRGSAAGSLVAYALGITDIDPLRYNLIFERFLNKERISMPDIDLDFPYDKRQEVIKYISAKYGDDHVANIITFGTFQAKQIFRDIAKVMNINPIVVNDVARDIDSSKTLSANLENLKLKVKFNSSNDLKKCLNICLNLEGLPRHTSIHAAGIVISKKPLIKRVPLVKSGDGYLTGISMEYLEGLGLLKMDILAIRNLTLIDQVLTSTNTDFNNIPLDDAPTFELFQMGLTEGIFQFEATGMKRFLQTLKPDKFTDLVAATALYRPGPMNNIYHFADRKNGQEKVEYPHSDITDILKETFGIIVYQEQIMQIASKMAGFSMAKADHLRKAMGKKDKPTLLKLQAEFTSGGLKQNYDEKLLNDIFELIYRFADYGFPKAHAVSYATISYKMAYLKRHYPNQFMLALLNINIGSEIKLAEYISECRSLKITITGPDINLSTDVFIIENNQLIYPLLGLKGVGMASVEQIVTERKNGVFTSFIDFLTRCYGGAVKENVLVALIKAGAFANFENNRNTLIKNIEVMLNYVNLIKNIDKSLVPEPEIEKYEEFSESEQLANEREIIGFYLSNHPTIKYKKAGVTNIIDLHKEIGKTVKVIGLVDKIKTIQTKKGDSMAFVTIIDETGKISVTCFPTVFPSVKDLLQQVIEIVGVVELRNKEMQLIANRIQGVKSE